MIPDSDIIPKTVPYAEQLAELHAEQSTMSLADIKQQMVQQSDATFDPATVAPPQHRWVDRGLKMSCEGAGHPNHSHFKY